MGKFIGLKSKAKHWLGNAVMLVLLAYASLVIFGKLPNPLDKYFEISPGSYRMLADAYGQGTPQYKHAVDSALKADGKITMAAYPHIFELWTQVINAPYKMPQSQSLSLEQERSGLLRLANATTK